MSHSPTGWSNDCLSEFFESAYKNTWASFLQLKDEYSRATKIDDIFCKSVLSLQNPPEIVNWFLMIRAHSSYRTACQLALGGQLVESALCQRSSLEFAVYALHLNGHPELTEIWVRRNDDDQTRKDCRRKFQIKPILDAAKLRLPAHIHRALVTLYDRSIDDGAHPNVTGVLVNSQVNRNSGEQQLVGIYQHGNGKLIRCALRNSARVGGVVIHIFREVFPRLQLLDTSNELSAATTGI